MHWLLEVLPPPAGGRNQGKGFDVERKAEGSAMAGRLWFCFHSHSRACRASGYTAWSWLLVTMGRKDKWIILE